MKNKKIPPQTERELGLFRFFVNQPVFINIVYGLVLISGMVLWFFVMNREAFGNFDFDVVQIVTPYPGATAQEVEQLVTMPLETHGNPLDIMIEEDLLPVEKPGQYDIRDRAWLGEPRPWSKITL